MRHKKSRQTERERRARKRVTTELARVRKLKWDTPARNDPVEKQHAIATGAIGATRTCDGKVKFATFKSAEKARGDIEARRPGDKLEAYACPFCRSYHLGHIIRDVVTPPPAVVPMGFRFSTSSPHLSTSMRKQG